MYRLAICIITALFCAVGKAQNPSNSGLRTSPAQVATEAPTPVDPEDMAGSKVWSLAYTITQHTSAGTSVEPSSTPVPMLMRSAKGWLFMLHGTAFLADTQQHANSPRNRDKLFSTNWIMPMAQHRVGPGTLTLRTMLSLEPATVTGRYFPELFQQGETAYGTPIIDGQHPHDFVMELAALYDLPIAEHMLLSLYLAPVGDPAIGPTAYPHRLSASEDPIATLSHHQQDSTHNAFNVMTAGLTYKKLRAELSGFHGAEPTEARWHLQPSPNGVAPDSISGRLTFAPTAAITAQYSLGHITSPEALSLSQNQFRQTASVMLTRPIGAHKDTTSMPGMAMSTAATGNWSTTVVWGQTKSLPDNQTENSYLLESLLTLRRNSFYTRIEAAARTSELLTPAPSIEVPLGHVQAYTVGYDRAYRVAPHVEAAPGIQFTQYRTADALTATYGRAPFSVVTFIRLRIR